MTKAELMDRAMYRMGLLAVLRSRAKGGQAIGNIIRIVKIIVFNFVFLGVMITASHNPDPEMAKSWWTLRGRC